MSLLADKILKARENNQPLFSTLEITQVCNLSCKHCYNFDRRAEESPGPQKIMPTDFAKNAIRQLADLGSLSLNITGGEPLLHPGLDEIIEYAKLNNFHVRLKTNGLLLTHKIAERLFILGLREIDISLYGSSESDYLSFCGKKGYEKTIKAIKISKEVNLKVNVSIILHKENFRNLKQLIQTCKDLEVFYNVSDEVTDRHDGSDAKIALGLDQNDYIELLNGEFSYFFKHNNPDKHLLCGCAKTVIGINVSGEVLPCIGAPINCGNLKEKALKDIWLNSEEILKIRKLKFKDLKDCINCSLAEYCNRSSGSALLNTGDFTGCDPMALEHAKARHFIKKDNT